MPRPYTSSQPSTVPQEDGRLKAKTGPASKITINDDGTCTFAAFVAENEFHPDEVEEMHRALEQTGTYEGGGGAQATFTIRLAP